LIDLNQLENVEYFKYLDNMTANDARWTCEIKSRIIMANATFSRKKTV
jgi:hypothetical protein